MNDFRILVAILAAALALAACSGSSSREMASSSPQSADNSTARGSADGATEDADATPEEDTLQNDLAVTYQGIIRATVENACLACHSEGGQAAFRPFSNYREVAAAIDAIIARTADEENPMPPLASPAIRNELNKLFIAWRDQGLPENEDGTISQEATDESGAVLMVAYIDAVKTTIDNACVACHSEGGQAAQFPLTTYAEVQAGVDASLIRLKDDVSPMPPAAGAEVRAQIAKLLEDWKAQGLPENLAP